MLLTSELFEFKENRAGVLELWIGTKKYPCGLLSIKTHRAFKLPRSIRIRKELGHYYVSFCYAQEALSNDGSALEQFASLQEQSRAYLEAHTVGIDRGVVIAAQTSETSYDLAPHEQANKLRTEAYLRSMPL